VAEVAAYKRDLPQADTHILDAGHFATYEKPGDIGALMTKFLNPVLGALASSK